MHVLYRMPTFARDQLAARRYQSTPRITVRTRQGMYITRLTLRCFRTFASWKLPRGTYSSYTGTTLLAFVQNVICRMTLWCYHTTLQNLLTMRLRRFCIWHVYRSHKTSNFHPVETRLNLLKTKRRLLYLKTQSVPRCKHFISVIKTNQFML